MDFILHTMDIYTGTGLNILIRTCGEYIHTNDTTVRELILLILLEYFILKVNPL